MTQKIVLVDISTISRPIYEASGREPDPDYVSHAIVTRVRELTAEYKHCAIACDSGRSFRHDISPEYKANRPETPESYRHQMQLAQETLKADGYPVWSVKGFEADDLIASAVYWRGNPDDSSHGDILIISADKDLCQLVSERVEQYRPANGKAPAKLYTVAEVKATFGVEPHQILDFLALVGDASDNIKGATGIGKITAAKILEMYGNLDDVQADYRTELGRHNFTPSHTKALDDFFQRMAEVRSLLALRTDVPLPFDEIFKERIPADVAEFGENTMGELTYAQEQGPGDDIDAAMPTLGGNDGNTRLVRHDTDSQRSVDLEVQRPEKERDSARIPGGLEGPHPSSSTTTTEALAVVEWDRQLEPRSLAQAIDLAKHMFASRLFGAYGTPQAVLSTIMAGRELGMPAMASMRAFHIIEGKPTLSSGVIVALVLKSGKAEYFRCSERTAERATFVTKRKGDLDESKLSYTIEEAKQAWSKPIEKFAQSGYGKNPADMLVARAGSKLARLVYPDVVSGLYAPDEFDKEMA